MVFVAANLFNVKYLVFNFDGEVIGKRIYHADSYGDSSSPVAETIALLLSVSPRPLLEVLSVSLPERAVFSRESFSPHRDSDCSVSSTNLKMVDFFMAFFLIEH